MAVVGSVNRVEVGFIGREGLVVGVSNIDTNHHGSVLVCKKMYGRWIWAICWVWRV